MYPSFQAPSFPPQMYGQGAPQTNIMGQPLAANDYPSRGSPGREMYTSTFEEQKDYARGEPLPHQQEQMQNSMNMSHQQDDHFQGTFDQ